MSSLKLEAKYNRRVKKVYDACAGRVRRQVQDKSYAVSGGVLRETAGPDDVLLENPKVDFVPVVDHPDLPNTELLTAIHYYASDYFKSSGLENLLETFDGTALIAIAVILEEKISDLLGPNGHLYFAQQKGYSEDSNAYSSESLSESSSEVDETEISEPEATGIGSSD